MAMATAELHEADRALVARIRRGEDSALAALYDRHAGILLALALRIAGERADAEEIVVDTFQQAWREAIRFSADRGSVAAWLTMICRSRALDLVRARGRRHRALTRAVTSSPDQAPAMGEARPSADVEQRERQATVAAAVTQLPDLQREAIELAFFEGLSHTEIAERLGQPLGTVKTRVRLGLQKLRDALRPHSLEAGI